MFDLAFTGDAPEWQDEGFPTLRGAIVIGDYTEDFLAPLGPWQRSDYERHWIEAGRRLVAGADRTAFITVAFQFWWPMWRDGDDVIVTEELLWFSRGAATFDPIHPFDSISNWSALSEDGDPVSHWRCHVADVAGFIHRRGESYGAV